MKKGILIDIDNVQDNISNYVSMSEICDQFREVIETLELIKKDSLKGDGTTTEINCHHLASECLENLGLGVE